MKKLVVSLIVGFIAVCAFSKPLWEANWKWPMSPSELNAVSNIVSNSKSVIAVKNELLRTGEKFIKYEFVKVNGLVWDEIDAAFAPLGVYACTRHLPLCSEHFLNATVPVSEYPELYAFLKKHNYYMVGYYWNPYNKFNLSFNEMMYVFRIGFENFPISIDNLKWWQTQFKNKYAIEVKHLLRSQGKSFVVGKDGVNPMASYMDALVKSLNSPRFAELDECMRRVGINDFNFDLSFLPNESQINALKNDILNGDEPFDKYNEALLLVCLGVERYNQFVKEYNGEE